jgi:hypothetical protein
MNHLTSTIVLSHPLYKWPNYNEGDVFPNERGDWNHDIHIRDIEREDFYNGITVQSYGNTNCIYELRFMDKKWFYKAIANIEDRKYGKLDSILVTNNGSWQSSQKEQWSETFYSIKFNKMIRRDKLLNDLLNEI